ncbi:hypothetical protein PMKS-000452 [Pichia membranifaciens]|uniref:Mediator of RNA polymerase II transcription subunit 14 n=1 Tax=Pichia membranifaciens TaxID=4926 RepID=A0A1Q2YBV8_9ASCO|nr:hypothetical protein PMKS-000452 [Pichia membranifaciens]
MSFGAIKSSLISAKMPEPDLLTSLEVLLQGRPNLPTYNFLPAEPLSPQFVLKVLHNLKVELSIKMSLQKNLPKAFRSYEIKDGCVFFNVPNYFSCVLSTLNDDRFHLIDFKLGFALIGNELKSSTEKSDPKTLHTIQQYSNSLLNSEKGLGEFYELLYTYSLTTKIYLLHKQLINMRMGLWRGHLTHNYNAEASLITITYWAQRKYAKPSTIQIGIFQDSKLDFKWFKDGILDDSHGLTLVDDNENISLLKLLTSLIRHHVQCIISTLKQSLIGCVEDVEKAISLSNSSEKLIFRVSQTKEIIYSIDSLSGSCYFENPTNFMNRSAFKINTGNSLDFIEILKLKMLIQESEFSSMMNATGWVSLKSVRLNQDEISKLSIDYSNLKNKSLEPILTSVDIYRRKDWPIGWSILVGTFGFQSNAQLWCSKIQSVEGQWIINWCSEININELSDESSSEFLVNSTQTDNKNVEEDDSGSGEKANVNSNISGSRSLTYNCLINMIKISSSKLISNLIVKELKDQGCELKVLNSNDKLVKDFLQQNFKIDNMNLTSTDNAVLLIKNKSLFNIQSAKESLVLLITIKNSDLNAKMFGKLINDNGVKNLPDIKYNDGNFTHFEYNSQSKIFNIESEVDLSHQFVPIAKDNFMRKDTMILSSILSFLNKFAKSLNLLKMVSGNPALSIMKVLSDGVTFKYGENQDEYMTLKITRQGNDNISIELPEKNPHYYCLPYLNEILSNDQVSHINIKEIVLYLRLTLKFCRKIHDLRSRTSVELNKFNLQNEAVDYENKPDDLQHMPSYGYLPFVCSLESLRLIYFKCVKVDTQQSTGKKKNTKIVSDVFKFEIKVELRHRSTYVSRKHSKFFISLGDLRTETTGKITSPASINNACGGSGKVLHDLTGKISDVVGKYFNGEDFPTSLNNGNITFLRDGLCCDFDSIHMVLEDLHTRLYALIDK